MYISERVLMKATANAMGTSRQDGETTPHLGRYFVASIVSAVIVSGAVISQIL